MECRQQNLGDLKGDRENIMNKKRKDLIKIKYVCNLYGYLFICEFIKYMCEVQKKERYFE